MKPIVDAESSDWPATLAALCSHAGPLTIVIRQCELHWLTDGSRALRDQVELELARLLFSDVELRLARVLLYDPPGGHLEQFGAGYAEDGESLHRLMTESLREWLRVNEAWSALFTSRRHLRLNRSEDERF